MYSSFVQQHINIPYYSNLEATSLGLDSAEHCFNREHFDSFGAVHYKFNEIGYRTHNVAEFKKDAILVIGDSFTVGLGVNAEDRYTDIMEKTLSKQVLNFSLSGASNDWIARKLQQLLAHFEPTAIILHYTFSHRRERPNTDWFDDERTECEPFYSSQENLDNWIDNFSKINLSTAGIKVIHSFIPNWHDKSVDYKQFGNNLLPVTKQIDYARDGFHYGVKTHQSLAQQITNLLAV